VEFADSVAGRLGAVTYGVPGYGPLQYALQARAVRSSTVVIMSYVGNDFWDTLNSKRGPITDGVRGHPGGLKGWMKHNLHLYRLVAKLYHQLSTSGRDLERLHAPLYDPKAWTHEPLATADQTYREAFRAIAEAQPHAHVVLIPTADRCGADALPLKKARQAILQAGLQEIPVELDRDLYFPFDGHLTPQGNDVVARAIADHLTRPSFKPPSEAPRSPADPRVR
jgi:hypothetical protein